MALLNSTCFAVLPTQRGCTIYNLYGHMTKRHLNTHHTISRDRNTWLAKWVDFHGLHEKITLTFKTASSEFLCCHGLFLLHKQPVSLNCLCQQQMFLAIGAAIPKHHWNSHCTEITDSVLLNCRTQKDFCCMLIIMCEIKRT